MSNRLACLNKEIDRRLDTVAFPGSPNRMAAAELRELAVEYLSEKDAEQSHHPQIAGQPHWNLWAVDARLEDALFAVLVFRRSGLEFICGTGDGHMLRSWDSDDPAHPDGLAAELRAVFRVADSPLVVERATAEDWLERSW